MSDLVDGARVPWHIVSGKREEIPPPRRSELPAPVTREPASAMRELSAQVAATTMLQAGQRLDSEISKFRTAMVAARESTTALALLQMESRRRWFRAVAESLKETE